MSSQKFVPIHQIAEIFKPGANSAFTGLRQLVSLKAFYIKKVELSRNIQFSSFLHYICLFTKISVGLSITTLNTEINKTFLKIKSV